MTIKQAIRKAVGASDPSSDAVFTEADLQLIHISVTGKKFMGTNDPTNVHEAVVSPPQIHPALDQDDVAPAVRAYTEP